MSPRISALCIPKSFVCQSGKHGFARGAPEKIGFLVPATALAIIQTKTGKAALLEANGKEEGRKFIEANSASPVLQGAQREAAGLALH